MTLPAKARSKEIKTLSDCTESQRNFIGALCSFEITEVPRKDRYRWAATQAGYSPTTPISQILGPIQHLVIEATQRLLAEASIEAAWTMRESLQGVLDANSKVRLQAASDILDRAVGKKSEQSDRDARNPPMAVLVLPAKQIKILEQAEVEDISPQEAGT